MIPENRIPTHPGKILREEFIKPMEIQQAKLAACLGIALQRLNEIVNEKRGITADTAWRLAQAFGTSPQFWMNAQTSYDLARERLAERTVRPLIRKGA